MRFLIIFFLLFRSTIASAFELNGEITQGALIIGKENPDRVVYINKQKIKLSKNGILTKQEILLLNQLIRIIKLILKLTK
jgi:hypothetical protein